MHSAYDCGIMVPMSGRPVPTDITERDPAATVEYELTILGRLLAGLPGRARRKGGVLDPSAYTLLSLLHAGGPSSIGELSKTTTLDASTLNRQTAALIRDGYAERIPDPEGGMARKFRLTPKGESAMTTERDAATSMLAHVTADWSQEDRLRLADLLTRLNLAIEADTGHHWPRPEQLHDK